MAIVSNIFIAQYYGTYEVNNKHYLLWFSNIFDIYWKKSDIKETMFNRLNSEIEKIWLVALNLERSDENFDKENNVYIEIYNYKDWYTYNDYINKWNSVWFAFINIRTI